MKYDIKVTMFAKNITVEGAEEFIKKAINEQQFPVEPVKGDLARIPIGTYPNTQGTPYVCTVSMCKDSKNNIVLCCLPDNMPKENIEKLVKMLKDNAPTETVKSFIQHLYRLDRVSEKMKSTTPKPA